VPDRCEILVDRRLVPGEEFCEVEQDLRDAIASKLGTAFSYELERILADPPLPGDTNSELARRALKIVGEVLGHANSTCVAYGSDASKFASAGMPAIVLGPGDAAQAHIAEEWVELAQVSAASEIYYRLMTEE